MQIGQIFYFCIMMLLVRLRVLSGVQPTGGIHLGNYLGAIKNWVDLLGNYYTYFWSVYLHAITAPHDPKELYR